MSEANWDEAEAFLAKLEKRVATLEARSGGAQTEQKAVPASAEALVQENKELKATVQKLEYRVLMLTRALRDADSKLNLNPADMQ
jgi:hypothetical protein